LSFFGRPFRLAIRRDFHHFIDRTASLASFQPTRETADAQTDPHFRFRLASASAQAFDIGSLIPANDTSAATTAPAEAAPTASRKQASSRSRKTQAQPRETREHETHEQQARQIGAQYGISW
jgi:ribosomal protein L12E/L44/L45/RPP1/RPP2